MNKRFWINMFISIMAYPVDMILKYINSPLEIRCLWLGITLTCLMNGVANGFAED